MIKITKLIQLIMVFQGTISQTYDFTSFPAVLQVATPNIQFRKLYDFSNVPNHPVAKPYRTQNGLKCDENASAACSWACGNCPKRDITSCLSNKDWGLTFDDGSSF